MRPVSVGSSVAALSAALMLLISALLLLPTVVRAQEIPAIFPPPPPGGSVIGIAGTSDPASLARVQFFEVESITMHQHGHVLTYWPSSPTASTLTAGLLRPDSLVLVRRAPPPPPPATAAPAPPPLSPGMLGLQTAIEAAVEAHRPAGRVAVSVLDLQTGEHIGFNADRQQLSGCVINLFVIMRAVLDVQEGRIPLSQVDSLIRRTTWSSNPVTARELYRIVGDGNVITGLERVERLIHDELGLREIVLNHPPGYAWSSDRLGRNSDNWITAATMNEALAAIVRGDLFDNAHRAYLLEVLGQVTPGLNYLTAAVPGAASVSHKNGFLWSTAGYVDNDAGIVRFQRGGQTYAYAITMLFEGYPAKHGNIPLGQRISSEVWSHFSATYR